MALTDDESARLHEIAASLRSSDRRLDRALARHRIPHRRTRAASIALGSSTCLVLILGIALRIPALCVVAWFAMLLSVVLAAIATG